MAADRLALCEPAGDSVHRVRARDIESVTTGGHSKSACARTTTRRLGEREHADIRRTGDEACRFDRVIDDLHAARARRGLKGERRLHRHLVRRREAAQQLAELEAVEHRAHPVVVVASPSRALQVEVDRDVADDRDHALAQADLVGMLLKRLLEAAFGQLIDPLEDGLDAAEVLHQLGRGLVADAGDARDVV